MANVMKQVQKCTTSGFASCTTLLDVVQYLARHRSSGIKGIASQCWKVKRRASHGLLCSPRVIVNNTQMWLARSCHNTYLLTLSGRGHFILKRKSHV
jgi:hypothetical protein